MVDRRIGWLLLTSLLSPALAMAQTTGTQTEGGQAAGGAAQPGPPTGFWERPTLLGDAGGVRTLLGDHGVTVNLTESSEVLGNVTGGFKQGFTYDGLTTLTVQVDSAKAFGFDGGTINVSGLQIHGRDLSQYYLGTLQVASGIEATPTTRLWEAWYQQAAFGGAVDMRAGLISIDQEFMTSQNSAPGDRNLVNVGFDGGVNLKGAFSGRDDDTLGIGYGLANVSGVADGMAASLGGSSAAGAVAGGGAMPRTREQFFELFYQMQVTPWLLLQPDFQYVIRPAGGVPDPNNPGHRLGDEAVFGARTLITF